MVIGEAFQLKNMVKLNLKLFYIYYEQNLMLVSYVRPLSSIPSAWTERLLVSHLNIPEKSEYNTPYSLQAFGSLDLLI